METGLFFAEVDSNRPTNAPRLLARSPRRTRMSDLNATQHRSPLLRPPQLEIAGSTLRPPRAVPVADPELTTTFLAAHRAWAEWKSRSSRRSGR